jgi:hypothetical protein
VLYYLKNTVFEVLISFGSEFHTFGPLKEKLDLYNSVFGFGTRKLSDDEILVSAFGQAS